MNSKIVLVARILVGLMMVVFGLNKFSNFMPPLELEGDALTYFQGIGAANVITVVAILEIATGLLLLIGRYVALALIINAPIAFNAVLFHLSLAPEGVGPAAFWLVLVVVLLLANKEKFAAILKP